MDHEKPDASTSDIEQPGVGNSHKTAARSNSAIALESPSRARRTGTLKARLIIFGALLLAATICAVHHVFLVILNGKNVEEFAIPQAFVRDIGNALSKVVTVLLRTSIGVVLTQTIWHYVRGNNVTLQDLDTLFSLPSISSLPSTLFKGGVLHVVLLTAVIQALSLVGIFAPNALSVVPASPVSSRLSVPVPALDRIPATTSSYFLKYNTACDDSGNNCMTLFTYMNPSSSFQTLTRGVMGGGVVFPWSSPSGCGKGCSYDVDYWGPALKCTEIPQSSIGVFNVESTSAQSATDPSIHVFNATHYLQGEYVYNATTNFGYLNNGATPNDTNVVTSFQSTPYGNPFSLDVVYATNNFSLPFTPKETIYYNTTGYSCAFHNATYTASVNYSNGSQTTSVRIAEYGAQLGPVEVPQIEDLVFQDGGAVNASLLSGSDPDFLATYSALSLASAMSQYVYGTIVFTANSDNDEEYLSPVFTSVFNSFFTSPTGFSGSNETSGTSNALSLSLISPTYTNLGRLLEDACTNLTASLMSDAANLGLRAEVSATVLPDENVYQYQVFRLWLPYGLALALSLLADVYGWICMLQNGGAMQRTFSSIAASMRTHEVDALLRLNEPGEPLPAHTAKVKLRYRTNRSGRSGFSIIDSSAVDEDGGEMSEIVVLRDEERR